MPSVRHARAIHGLAGAVLGGLEKTPSVIGGRVRHVIEDLLRVLTGDRLGAGTPEGQYRK